MSCTPEELAELAKCYLCTAPEINDYGTTASICVWAGGVPPPMSGIVLGDPDAQIMFGDPNSGIVFGAP